MAHGSRLMPKGSWLKAHGSWAMSHEPWGMSHEPRAMSHEPITINNRSNLYLSITKCWKFTSRNCKLWISQLLEHVVSKIVESSICDTSRNITFWNYVWISSWLKMILQKMREPNSRIIVGDISNNLTNHERRILGDCNLSKLELLSASWSRIKLSPSWKAL